MEGEHKLFVCFTSRQSSMRLGPKCALSPGREKLRESSSRRLRSNGSKGQSSPMFPVLIPYNLTGRKKNTGFETQEPSSPKVTCIGQVRVKSKHNKRLNASKVPGERHEECSRKWGHIFSFRREVSFSFCEALRSFGAEFNCFVPCGGTSHPPKENKEGSNCSAVFAKWFMVLQEDDRKAQESEIKNSAKDMEPRVLLKDTDCKEFAGDVEPRAQGSDEGLVNVCEPSRPSIKGKEDTDFDIAIPPRNALLLMRCRSDPLRMSAMVEEMRCRLEPMRKSSAEIERREFIMEEEDGEVEVGRSESEDEEKTAVVSPFDDEDMCEGDTEQETQSVAIEDSQSSVAHVEQPERNDIAEVSGREAEATVSGQVHDKTNDHVLLTEVVQEPADEGIEEEAKGICNDEQGQDGERADTRTGIAGQDLNESPEKRLVTTSEGEKEKSPRVLELAESLPEALLLMMYEPKLSMEISKETWVSKEDFLRRPGSLKHDDKENDQKNSRLRPTDDVSEALEIESAKCVNRGSLDESAKMLETPTPAGTAFVLPRCKSEPLRASVKLVPEACFWKPRNLENPPFNIKIGARLGF